jgi:hyperosmotically inducible protein
VPGTGNTLFLKEVPDGSGAAQQLHCQQPRQQLQASLVTVLAAGQACAKRLRAALCVLANRHFLKITGSSVLLHSLHKGHTMNIKLATGVFIIGSLLAPMAAHAEDADSDRSHPMTFVKDSAITTKIKAKLAAEKIKSLVNIKVDTNSKGMVVLSGIVRTQEEADKAVSIAQGTEGVTSVTSKLRIKKDD